MLQSNKVELINALKRHFGSEQVLAGDDSSSVMIFPEYEGEVIEIYIQFVEDTEKKSVITIELGLIAEPSLPVDDISYPLHVLNYAAIRKNGLPNFMLSVRPGIKNAEGYQLLPAIVMIVSRHALKLKESDLIALINSSLIQGVQLKSALHDLINATIQPETQ